MNQKTKRTFASIGIGLLALIGVMLNHSSYDIARYSPESIQQQEAIERGHLNVIGPFSYNINFDGSVVPPLSFANDVRTGIIDGILVLFGGLLVWQTLQKNNS